MSEVVSIRAHDYIKSNPQKDLDHHLWRGRLWKVAAVATLVAYTILAVVATIATGVLTPIYLPITMTAALLIADCVYNKIYEPLNANAKYHRALAKVAQGIVHELGKLKGTDKRNYLKARYKYFEKYTKRCEKKINQYRSEAEDADDNRPTLLKAGTWLDKYLRAKSTAAYCKALKENKKVEAPIIHGKDFAWRAFEKKFLKKCEFLELSSGAFLSAHEIEVCPSIKDLSKKILEDFQTGSTTV